MHASIREGVLHELRRQCGRTRTSLLPSVEADKRSPGLAKDRACRRSGACRAVRPPPSAPSTNRNKRNRSVGDAPTTTPVLRSTVCRLQPPRQRARPPLSHLHGTLFHPRRHTHRPERRASGPDPGASSRRPPQAQTKHPIPVWRTPSPATGPLQACKAAERARSATKPLPDRPDTPADDSAMHNCMDLRSGQRMPLPNPAGSPTAAVRAQTLQPIPAGRTAALRTDRTTFSRGPRTRSEEAIPEWNTDPEPSCRPCGRPMPTTCWPSRQPADPPPEGLTGVGKGPIRIYMR